MTTLRTVYRLLLELWHDPLGRCRCRSYHRRTGLHAPDCPLS